MRRVRRPEEISNRIRLLDFPTLLSLPPPLLFLVFSFFFLTFSRRERGHARLSSTQSAVPGMENNEAVRRNVKFSVTSTIHGIAHRFEIVILLPIIDNYMRRLYSGII